MFHSKKIKNLERRVAQLEMQVATLMFSPEERVIEAAPKKRKYVKSGKYSKKVIKGATKKK